MQRSKIVILQESAASLPRFDQVGSHTNPNPHKNMDISIIKCAYPDS